MKTFPKNSSYLGDGAYVYHDGYSYVIYTSDGLKKTNEIFLEPPMIAKFNQYVYELKKKNANKERDK